MFLGYREPFQHSSHHLRAVTVLSVGCDGKEKG